MNGYLDKYDKTTITKCDIIGSFFVNLTYNEFYNNAVNIKLSNKNLSITDAYKNTLVSYLEFIKKPKCFKQIIHGIHIYCISNTKYTTMSHKDCVEFMILEFIPQKLRESLREEQKNKLFHETIISCTTLFIKKIISTHLSMIIDNHSVENNIIILQNVFLEIILLEKDKIYAKFLNPKFDDETISLSIFKSKLTDILNDKKELLNKNNNLVKKINMFKEVIDKSNSVIVELQTKNKSMYLETKTLKNTINDLKHDIEKLKQKPVTQVQVIEPIVHKQVESVKIIKEEIVEDEDIGVGLLDSDSDDESTLKFDKEDDFYNN